MEKLNNYKTYLIITALFVIINTLLLFKWSTIETDYSDNNYAGAITTLFIAGSILLLNMSFFIGFVISGLRNKAKRKLYFVSSLFSIIPIVFIIFQ